MDKCKVNYKFGVLAGLTLIAVGGCASIGNAPAGPSIQQVKASFDAKPLEQRAKEINQMTIPEGIRQQTIKKMYEKEGKTAPAEVLSSSGSQRPVTGH